MHIRTSTSLAFFAVATLVSCTSGVSGAPKDLKLPLEGLKIPPDSNVGKRLLSKAVYSGGDRQLGDGGEFNAEWVKYYSIKFDGCHHSPRFESQYEMTSSLLVKFKLCPTNKGCDSCQNEGDYLVSARDFLEAASEAATTQREFKCEMMNEKCEAQCENQYNNYNNYNGNDDDEDRRQLNDNNNYCVYNCLEENEMSYCANDEEAEEIDYDEYMDCAPIDGNGNYYDGTYYVGADCVDGGLYLGTFTDSMCQVPAASGTFEYYMGYGLPNVNLIPDDCISCKEPSEYDYNYYGNDRNDNDEVLEVCEALYAYSGKCETNLDGVQFSSYHKKDESACEILEELDPTWFNSMTSFQWNAMKAITALACVLLLSTIFFAVKSKFQEGLRNEEREDLNSTYYNRELW